MSASDGGNARAAGYAPHPYVGGRAAALRSLAAWRMRWPGAPRVVVLTGSPGSGRSRLITGFLMMCDPDYRKRLPLDDLEPATVPPDLPAPAVPSPAGRTAAQVLWLLADHFGLSAGGGEDVFAELAGREEPVTIVVPDVDQAGPVRAADEPARLVRDVLIPLAATETVQLLADVPRELAAELAGTLPGGQAQIIDLDAPEWADPQGLVLHAETALDPGRGAPQLPYTTDPSARRALAAAMAERAGGNRLTLQLAVQSLLLQPDGFDPADASLLPGSVGEALDLHARRLGADPRTLRLMLAPLAFAEGEGLPLGLLAPLASALAGRDMSQDIADGMPLAAPFVQSAEESADGGDPDADGTDRGADADGTDRDADADGTDGADGGASGAGPADGRTGRTGRTLLRLMHPALAAEIRSGLPDVRDAQTKNAMMLLEAVPQQDWSQADPYVRDHLAAHTLEAGLLPQLLTDPGLFAHADPVTLRAAVEAVPSEQLGAPARTYLRTAPLLTRSQAPAGMRAAFLESAFVEDGLAPYAEALHARGFTLPWRTLWSVPLTGVRAVTTGSLPADGETGATADTAEGGSPAAGDATAPRPVISLTVPEGTPGSRTLPAASGDVAAPGNGATAPADGPSAQGGQALLLLDLRTGEYLDADPARVVQPSEETRAAAPFGLRRGADYLRVRARASQEVVAALLSDSPLTGADLSPDGVLVVATERGVTARQILAPVPAAPAVPRQRPGTADGDAPRALEGDPS
ncbi:ATP-binding protein [Streptomyces sp. NPDC002446]